MLAGDRGELGDRRLLRESDDAEVRLVDAQEECRVRADRAVVVRCARPVRRPDLAQLRAGAREDVRNAEAVADLDQLAPRDEDLAPLAERRECEHHGGGVVVHDERRLGTRQAAQDRCDVGLSRTARAAGEVVLEVRVPTGRCMHAIERLGSEWRAPEIRVRDHAGRVDDTAKPRGARRVQLGLHARGQIARIAAGADLLPRAVEDRTCSAHGERIVERPRELVDRRQVAKVHARESRNESRSLRVRLHRLGRHVRAAALVAVDHP